MQNVKLNYKEKEVAAEAERSSKKSCCNVFTFIIASLYLLFLMCFFIKHDFIVSVDDRVSC